MPILKLVLAGILDEESGQDLIEYALIASVVGLAAVAALASVATSIITVFGNLTSHINSGN